MRNKNKKHGMGHTKIYARWKKIISRCQNPKDPKFHQYGGRGISVSNHWQKFENFYKDMGDPPSPGHTLDRINNNKGYSKGNCRWATHKQQQNNRRDNRILDFDGIKLPITEWGILYEINPRIIRQRIDRDKWSVKKAITHPAPSKFTEERACPHCGKLLGAI